MCQYLQTNSFLHLCYSSSFRFSSVVLSQILYKLTSSSNPSRFQATNPLPSPKKNKNKWSLEQRIMPARSTTAQSASLTFEIWPLNCDTKERKWHTKNSNGWTGWHVRLWLSRSTVHAWVIGSLDADGEIWSKKSYKVNGFTFFPHSSFPVLFILKSSSLCVHVGRV